MSVSYPLRRKTCLGLALAAASCTGVGRALAQGGAPQRITVASFPDLDRAALGALARWKTLRPDVEVKVVSLQYVDHHNAMTTALATGSGLPDVMGLDLRFVGRFAAGRGLTDLNRPPFDAAALRPRFVPYSWAQGTNARGEMVAIPADIGPGTLLYRTDLMARAGITEAELTHSWESFVEAGRRLKRATGAFLLAESADLRDMVLREGIAPGDGLYFGSQGQVLLESPRFVRAFELARQARGSGIDAGVTAWANDWVAGFRRDRIAAQMMGAWLAGHLKNWLAPASAGRWRSALLPGGLNASYGGSFYAIPARAANPAAAWDFIRFMCADPQTQLDSLRTMDGFPALLEAQQGPLFDEPLPYLGGQPARRLWRDIATKVPPVPVHALDALATEAMRAEYARVIFQDKPVRKALADARRLVEHRMRR